MCNKISFTKVEAQTFLNKVKNNYHRKYRREQRKYWCNIHKAWHVTSSPEKEEDLDVPLQFTDTWQNLLTWNITKYTQT